METKLAELERKVRKGLEDTHKKLLEFKKNKNTPLVVDINGEIVEIKIDPT